MTQKRSGLANLWTHPNRPSNYKLTSCCESDQAEQESGHTDSLIRCESALNDLLTNRGKPSRDLDHILADDPQFIIGHCLRAAIIVRADDIAARSKLLASVTALDSHTWNLLRGVVGEFVRIDLEAGWARDALKGPDGAAIAAHQEATSSFNAAFEQAGRGNIGGEKCELWIAPTKWA